MNIIESIVQYLPQLLPGLGMSFLLLAALVLIGTPLAFVLAFGLRNSLAPVRWLTVAVVEIARGMPSLVLLYLVYFGLPSAGLELPAFAAAAIALGLNYAGYVSETVKSGLESLPKGQFEAGDALGLDRWTKMRFIVIPQSMKVITPPLLSWIIVYFQTTSIAFAIAVPELTSVAYSIAASNFQYLAIFVVAGLLYAAISIPGSQIVSYMETRAKKTARSS
ncbi:amino acid ABC transporter permease [Paenarthrobacter sp. NPDC058040]|uniref:amino acid ABC transporter permease n=1 Tax=unclassified Paenarthrobacter TaxID=2634190 RepID=UPI0036DB12FA